MLEVNKSMNLTAIRDPDEAWQRHIEDSLALLPVIDSYRSSSSSSSSGKVGNSISSSSSNSGSSSTSSSGSSRVRHTGRRAADDDSAEKPAPAQQQQQQLRVIDVGTGAGLPGMVLAVARPHWKVTLLDSLRKRCDFLQATADMLGLDNVTVVWARAEEGGRKAELRDAYDLAVARAVAELRVLSELCLPFVRPGGLWVAAKGAHPQEEVAAAKPALAKLGGKLQAVELVESWAPEGQRTAVVVAKTGSTPAKYPRAPGTPSKKPL
ncbi:hypothetical protein OEZ85_000804 [Tetradesmus obliquus]|uniref:Ribosomal RNA small subunit methyltransferase G n=1 Tax=Tetradesmus obliquus TaxID=3088 RepID=A0ABY8UJC3_TETOB|nr:hypothetical protein OEZ85_000804 [Tetradesmus obliquus]